MRKETYFLKAITPLHIGAGQGLGYIDLPIVREVHTNYPYIPGSSLKGALRNYHLNELAKKVNEKRKPAELDEMLSKGNIDKEKDKELYNLAKVFGIGGEGTKEKTDKENTDKEETNLGAGKVIFTDAFVVVFPVRSVKGVYSLITCPSVINRLYEFMDKKDRIEIKEGYAKVISIQNHLNITKNKLLLEEFVFDVEEDKSLEDFAKLFKDLTHNLQGRLACVSDTDFKDFVSNYTEVQTHIKIDLNTGTVNNQALWNEEYVPPETIFAFGLFYLEEDLTFSVPQTFHLGGDITTGKGFVKVKKVEV